MRRSKRSTWFVFVVFLAALLICATSGVFPNPERQAEEALALGDADAVLRLVRDGLDPKTEVCTFYMTPDWAGAFPFSLLPDNVFPKVCKTKSPLLVEAVRGGQGPNLQTLVAELLRRGAKVNVHSGAGDSPLVAAVENGNVEVTNLLLDHGAARDTGDVRAAFHEALRIDNVVLVCTLLARGQSRHERFPEDNNKTPLMVAVQYGSVKAVELLVERQTAPNAQDIDGETALGLALCRSYGDDKKRIPQLLLRHGASLFIKNHDGATPFDRLTFAQEYYKATGQTAKIPSVYSGPPPP